MKTPNYVVAASLLAAATLLLTGCKEAGGGRGGDSGSLRIEVPVEQAAPGPTLCSDESQLFGLEWVRVYPQNGRTDVATGAYILARFTHEPDPQSFNNATYGLQSVGQAIEEIDLNVTVNGQDVSFEPSGDHLLANMTYRFYMQATGESGITAAECEGSSDGSKYLVFLDANGEVLLGTDGQPETEKENTFTTIDKNYLEVAYTVPEDGEDNVRLDITPVVVFNQAIDVDTLSCEGSNANVRLSETAANEPLSTNCAVTEDGTKAVLTPAQPLQPSHTYELVLDSTGVKAKDATAESMAATTKVKFTTLSSLEVVGTSPEHGDKNILPNVLPNVEFNQPIIMDEADCAVSLSKYHSDGVETSVAGSCDVSADGKTVVFTPNEALEKGDYQLVVEASKVFAAADDSVSLDAITVVSFNVGDGSLAVVRTMPVDGDNDIEITTHPLVTFNQSVLLDLDNCPVTLDELDQTQGLLTSIDGDCSLTEETVTFTPKALLEEATYYQMTVNSAKVSPEETNVAPMKANEVVVFRTNGTGPTDVLSCSARVSGLCLLGGPGNPNGLVDLLLADNVGPLAPLASQIGGKEKLAAVLETLLENPDGELATLVENLIIGGNLAEGLEQLLISDKGLQSVLPELLMGSGEGGGLQELLVGEEGARGLLQALLIPADSTNGECASPLGNVCLVAAEGSGKHGVLDLILGADSQLGQQGFSTQALVDALATTLGGNPDLGQTVAGLFIDGNLQAGLEELFLGNSEKGPALLKTLEDLGKGLTVGLCDIIAGLFGQRCS